MPYIGKPQSSDPITVNASNIEDGSIIAADISSSLGDAISGSFTTVSSSLGSRVTLVEGGTTSKTLVSSSAQIATSISGSSTSLSSSLSTRATTLESASGSFASDLVTLKGSGTTQGVGQGNSPTFAAGTITGNFNVGGTLTAQEIHTEFESASIIFTSGSTIFGDSSDDVHNMTGSLNISGSLSVKDGTLTVTDNVDFNGDLDVDGTTNLDVVDIDGAVTQDGGHFIINEGGADYDFRVESDGNTHALVMDGQQGFIGMGASAPGYVNGNDHRGGNTQTTSGAGGLLHLEGLVPRIILDDTGDTPQFAIEAQDYFSILELADDSTTETTRFRIAKDTGNIGIGVSSPGGDLVVSSSTKTDVLVGGNSSVFSDNGRSNVEINGSGTSTLGMTIGGAAKGLLFHDGTDSYFRNYANGYFAIYTNNSEKVRIDSSGNLLVGKTSGTSGNLIETDGRISAGAGSTGQPTFNCEGDTNTGINLPESDRIQFITAGSEAVRIDSSQRVGIGTDTPAAELDIQNSSEARLRVRRGSIYTELAQNSSGAVLTMDKANGDAGIQFVAYGNSYIGRDSVDNLLGIGTTSPVARVHIHNAGDGSGGVSSGGDEDTLIVSSSIRHFTAQFDNAAGNYDSSIIGLNTPGRSGATAFNFLRAADNSEEKTKIRGDGSIQARNTTLQAFDYAEFFEVALTEHTASGIPAGVTVALTGSKVIPASQSSEEPIGIVRPRNAPAIIGNSPWNHWHAKYKTTDYGAPILDENQNSVVNPSYVSQSYTPREDRDEWVIVGLLGQIPITNGQPTGSSWRKMHNISPTASMWFVK